MHKLIIRAHPKADTGYNYALLQAILEENKKHGHTYDVLDLYKDVPQGFLHFDRQEIPHQKEIQELIKKADELVFLFPIRWLDGPAILKNFLDCNLSVGFAYEQTKEGKTIGLLK
ncbi:MAG: NAD(P)H-dependent oxidoreductase [bacterium]